MVTYSGFLRWLKKGEKKGKPSWLELIWPNTFPILNAPATVTVFKMFSFDTRLWPLIPCSVIRESSILFGTVNRKALWGLSGGGAIEGPGIMIIHLHLNHLSLPKSPHWGYLLRNSAEGQSCKYHGSSDAGGWRGPMKVKALPFSLL